MRPIVHLLPLAKAAGVEKRHLEILNSTGLQNPLYRRFHKPEYANDFVAGKIRLSTLSACRALEALRGGDPEEGFSSHHVSHLQLRGLISPARIGNLISFDASEDRPIANVEISNARQTQWAKDSFLLCLSHRMTE